MAVQKLKAEEITAAGGPWSAGAAHGVGREEMCYPQLE